MSDYTAFLEAKVDFSYQFGFDVDPAHINPILKPHQADIVRWAIRGGRRAIFAAFGLGKTLIQLELLRLISAHTQRPTLIVCPLGVRQEFTRDAQLLGTTAVFIRRAEEITGPGIYLTNYETVRDGKLDPNLFVAVTLDEAAVLRSFGSKTYQTFLPLFAQVEYRFVATATPSPNRYKELIHYAGFLGVMDTGNALTRFFQRDSTQANNLTLYPHKETEFWAWLHSWSIFLQKPSDLGHDDDGYQLPPMDVRWHEIITEAPVTVVDRDGQAHLFRSASIGVADASKEKRSTLDARVAKAVEIVNESPDDHFIIWHHLEDERRAIKKAIPEAVEVFGNLDLDTREQRIVDFSEGRSRILATKPELSGSGCNFQRHCHRAIFLGVDFKFNDFIQAVHRIYRFLQTDEVRIDIIHSHTEREVVQILLNKWDQHERIVATMTDVIREHGLSDTGLTDTLQRSMNVERQEATGDGWLAANNDCIEEVQLIDTDSIDLIVTSIPFSNHYEYTPNYRDLGHTDDNDHFWAQMDFLTPQLLRILAPGRIYACHVKDRILFGNVTGAGAPTVSPFHAEALFHGRKHGFDYMGMITVVTDVVRENNQTYRLTWSEQCKDGTKMGVGSPEYVLLFRKPQTDRTRGYADTPVVKTKDEYSVARWQVDAHAFWRSSGNRHLTPEELAALPHDVLHNLFRDQSAATVYDYEQHVALGEQLGSRLPKTFMSLQPGSHNPDVWVDVNRMLTLNAEQARRAEANHVCPLQFDIVDRLINRYSNPGDLVFDPFGGLMTVPMRALALGRRGRGVELNPDYYAAGVRYLQIEEAKQSAPTLFDLADAERAVADTKAV